MSDKYLNQSNHKSMIHYGDSYIQMITDAFSAMLHEDIMILGHSN